MRGKPKKPDAGPLIAILVALSAVFTPIFGCAPLTNIGKTGAGATSTFQIPWPDESGQYHLQKVHIPSFTNPSDLNGLYAKILVDPYSTKSSIDGTKPVGRFARTADGVMIPEDYVTLMATAIQGHFERLHAMNIELGISDAAVSWPASIGVEANVKNSGDQTVIRDNAIFERSLNALLIAPYSEASLPIGLNGGILAHENFHRNFQALVLSKLTATTGPAEAGSVQAYNETLLRAMNEGFADFWGWVYTGDPDFLMKSIPAEQKRRSLNLKAEQLPSTELLRDRLALPGFAIEGARINLAYNFSSNYSRLLHDLAVKTAGNSQPSFEQRKAIAQSLIRALPALAEQAVNAQNKNEYLTPNAILKPLQAQLEVVDTQTCAILLHSRADEDRPSAVAGGESCP